MLFFSLFALAAGQLTREFSRYQPTWNLAKTSRTVVMPNMDLEYLLAAAANDTTKIAHIGEPFEVDIDVLNSGAMMRVAEGAVFTTEIYMENAVSLAFFFSKFELPEGAAMFILSSDDADEMIGPLTHETRWESGTLQTRHLRGNRAQIQIFHSEQLSVQELGIKLDTVTSGFAAEKRAGACNINVVCMDPANRCNTGCRVGSDTSCNIQCTYRGGNPANNQFAGSDWVDQQNSVVGILTSRGSRYCSGAFIDNSGRRQYVWTAAHCRVSTSDLVQQGFWNSDCTSSSDTAGSTSRSVGSLSILAQDTRIDHALINVGATIPTSWNVYLSGYDTTQSLSTGVVGIHHPSGANMKISGSDPVPTAASWSGSGTRDHWRVAYWTEATTEPGSSGSPIYASNTKRIIGQLHGGSARCPSYQGYDDYGAIWASYALNTASFLGGASMNGRTLY
jgi:V8-like Glu-specific endopeptidase